MLLPVVFLIPPFLLSQTMVMAHSGYLQTCLCQSLVPHLPPVPGAEHWPILLTQPVPLHPLTCWLGLAARGQLGDSKEAQTFSASCWGWVRSACRGIWRDIWRNLCHLEGRAWNGLGWKGP